jgi:hypothetical protein
MNETKPDCCSPGPDKAFSGNPQTELKPIGPMSQTVSPCCGTTEPPRDLPMAGVSDCCCGSPDDLRKLPVSVDEGVACCGTKPGPPSAHWERPGYQVCSFVEEFMETPAGLTPRTAAQLGWRDYLGGASVRLGGARSEYRIAPGLYAVGRPDADSPVLVTANYKLSFDSLRKELTDINAWVIALDTRGINVWCAAGKKTFSAEEIVRQVRISRLENVVSHRKIILPQLGAPGVSAREVKRGCGFEVVWGPIRAKDIPAFLSAGMEADPDMRRVTFTLPERLVLAPVEISQLAKPVLAILIIAFVLSGIGPHIFSLSAAWIRTLMIASGLGAGILAGTIFTPMLLPWLPTPVFAVKGAVAGLVSGVILAGLWWPVISWVEIVGLLLFTTVISSYLAMNFTGSTPFTSPSGVEKEMRRAIPVQVIAVIACVTFWIVAAFYGAAVAG